MELLGLHLLDWLSIAAYFVLAAGIGLYIARQTKDTGDYFMGGRRFGKLYTIAHALGTGTSSEQPVAVAGASYQLGLAGIWYQWLYLFATPFYWLLAPIYRRLRYVTTGDFFQRRYGGKAAIAYTCLGLFNFIVSIGMILKGTALTVDAISGGQLPFIPVVLVMTLAFIIYSILGGLRAAVTNDVLQGGLIIVLSVMLLPYAINAAGGWLSVQQNVPDAMWSFVAPQEVTLFFIIMTILNALTGIVVEPHHMAVCGAAKNEYASRSGWTFGNFIKRFLTLAWALTGILAALLYPGLENREHAFGTLVTNLLPAGLIGLMIACMVAAVNSTCSAFMVGAGALFARNVYQQHFNPTISDKKLLMVARVASAVVVLAGVLLAITLPSLIAGLKLMWTTSAAFGIAFWLAIVWKRANRYGMFASIFVVVSVMLATGRFGLGFDLDWGVEYQIALYLPLGFITMIVVSLLTPAENPENLRQFYALLETPVGSEAELHKAKVEIIEASADGEQDPSGATVRGVPQGLLVVDLLSLHKRFSFARYRVDLLGFSAAWGLVIFILSVGATVAWYGRG
jgi:Na+/proline symporter